MAACPNGHENPVGRAFCSRCGVAIAFQSQLPPPPSTLSEAPDTLGDPPSAEATAQPRGIGRWVEEHTALTVLAGLVVCIVVAGVAVRSNRGDEVGTDSSTALPTSSVLRTTFRSDASGGFTVQYPETWSEAEPPSGFVVGSFLSPDSAIRNGIRPNVNIVVEPLNVELDTEAYANSAISVVSGTFADFEQIDRGTATVSGLDAIWIEYHATQQGQRLLLRQVIFVHGRDGIVVTYTANDDSFEDQLYAALVVEGSLRFDD